MMKKAILLTGIISFLFIAVTTSYAQEASEDEIPSWVKKNMVWWGEDMLEDYEMINMLEWLVNSEVIKLQDIVVKKTVEVPEITVPDTIAENHAQEISEYEGEISDYEIQLEKMEVMLAEKDVEREALGDIYNKEIAEHRKLIRELQSNQEINKNINKNTTELDKIIEFLRNDNLEYRNLINSLEDELVKNENRITGFKDQVAQLNAIIHELNVKITTLENN